MGEESAVISKSKLYNNTNIVKDNSPLVTLDNNHERRNSNYDMKIKNNLLKNESNYSNNDKSNNENENNNNNKYKNSRLDNEPFDDSIDKRGENIIIPNDKALTTKINRNPSNLIFEQSNKLLTEDP